MILATFASDNCIRNSVWLESEFGWPCCNAAVGAVAVVSNFVVLLVRNLADIMLVIAARALYGR